MVDSQRRPSDSMIALNDQKQTVRGDYQRRFEERRDAVKQLASRESQVVNARVLVFFIGLFFAFAILGPWKWHWSTALVPAILFLGLVVVHRRLKTEISFRKRSVRHYQRAIDRVQEKWHGTGPTGQRYLQAAHPYAGDLDLFGEGGLFQLICAARTRMGEDTLASWLLKPADPEIIRRRQEAVDELT